MKFKEYLSEDERYLINSFTNWQLINYFKNFNEVFDRYEQIKIIKKSNDTFITKFVINNIDYYFHSSIKGSNAIILFYPLDDEIDLFKERKNNVDYLGVLFSSVIQSVKLLLKEYDLNLIGFTAENKKLESIYNLLDKTIQKRFYSWKLKDIQRNKEGKLNYTYIRK